MKHLCVVIFFVVLSDTGYGLTCYREVVNGVDWSYYYARNGEATIANYDASGNPKGSAIPTSTSGMLAIPSSLGGCPVTRIGWHAFSQCTKLAGVTIPDSVTTIGDHAFWKCSSLTSVVIPDSVTNFGCGVFRDCTSLETVALSHRLSAIVSATFEGCTCLTCMTIPDSVATIDWDAFSLCSNLKFLMFTAEDHFPRCKWNGFDEDNDLYSVPPNLIVCAPELCGIGEKWFRYPVRKVPASWSSVYLFFANTKPATETIEIPYKGG